jgi:hypothetical protein
MEKIVIGAPYEISIEPSIDIGKFDSELRIELDESTLAVALKPIKGEKDSYSFIVPSSMKDVIGKSALNYCICVYKENARFEVDDGKLKFIDESDFTVKVKDNKKMRRMDEPEKTEEEEKGNKKKTSKKVEEAKVSTKTPPQKKETMEELAERLMEAERKKAEEASVNDYIQKSDGLDDIREATTPKPTPPTISPSQQRREAALGSILENIESKKARDRKKDNLNNNIKKAINRKQD